MWQCHSLQIVWEAGWTATVFAQPVSWDCGCRVPWCANMGPSSRNSVGIISREKGRNHLGCSGHEWVIFLALMDFKLHGVRYSVISERKWKLHEALYCKVESYNCCDTLFYLHLVTNYNVRIEAIAVSLHCQCHHCSWKICQLFSLLNLFPKVGGTSRIGSFSGK